MNEIYKRYAFIKDLYLNGDRRLWGSKNIYGVWNCFVFKLYKKITDRIVGIELNHKKTTHFFYFGENICILVNEYLKTKELEEKYNQKTELL